MTGHEMGGSERSADARPWRMVSAAIGGLLAAIAAVGIVGIVVNERVRDVTEHALIYDIALKDEGDDLRLAVLDLRHYHRNIAIGGATAGALDAHAAAYAALLEEIGELEELDVADLDVVQPAALRGSTRRYYDDFRAATPLFGEDPEAFGMANDEGLQRIGELERAAEGIDDQGERQTETSLLRVDRETTFARLASLALLAGVALVGAMVAVAAGRVLAQIRRAYARERVVGRELARALRVKTDFIADASHELRTPLTVIRGNAEIGLAAPGAPIHQEVLRDISAEANHMSRLVDDLLFLARSDSGAPPLEREYVPVRWLLRRLVKPAEILAQQHGGCLTADLVGDGFVEVDANRFQQAVMIAVDNAAKHNPPGACVALTSRVAGGGLTVEIADAGPGIPPEELPLVFDRFYQVGRRRTRKKGGSGLGLPIAKTILEAHGGSIGVESRPHGGTRLTVRLPLCAPPPATVEPLARPATAEAGVSP